jgi:hypothetical protein
MHPNRLLRSIVTGAFIAFVGISESRAQYANDPFFDSTLRLSHVYGLEMVAQRLRITEAFPPPINEPLGVQLRRMVGKNLDRFHGTLSERNPALAEDLRAALQEVMKAVDGGNDTSVQIAKARALLSESYDTLIEPAIQGTPVFTGAVLANMLLANDGVAEAYEDAIHELWGFPNGWGSLQRIRVLWAEVEPLASEARRYDARLMLAAMEVLYNSPQPPDPFDKGKAEDAEGAAHMMVSIIEEVVDANLYTGRDVPRLATHLSQVVGVSCDAYAAGEDAIGIEGIYAVLDHYRVNIAGALDLIAPEVRKQGSRLFPRLVETEWDFKVEVDDRSLSNAQACIELMAMFLEARSALGG